MSRVVSGPASFKVRMYRNPALLVLLRSAPTCMGCLRANDGTVVAAHSNEGKGMGLKASDGATCALCFDCHSAYDQGRHMTRDQRRAFFYEAHSRTIRWLFESGHLVVVG